MAAKNDAAGAGCNEHHGRPQYVSVHPDFHTHERSPEGRFNQARIRGIAGQMIADGRALGGARGAALSRMGFALLSGAAHG